MDSSAPIPPPLPEKSRASLVPLDFGDGRQELSLVFISYEWHDLVSIIRDPVKFFAASGSSWNQITPGGEDPYEWDLLSDCTLVLEWIGGSSSSIYRSLAMAPGAGEDSTPTPADLKDPETLKKVLDKHYPTGVIHAEFALNTRILYIKYHPCPTDGLRPRRFSGKYTSSTLVKHVPADPAGYVGASVHFDIGQNLVQRARFVVDYLEDWIGVVNEAISAQGTTFRTGEANHVEKGGTIEIKAPVEATPPTLQADPDNGYPTVIVESRAAKATAPAALTSAAKPVLTADYGDDPCQVCIEINGVLVNPTTMNSGTTVVKCYIPPGPPN